VAKPAEDDQSIVLFRIVDKDDGSYQVIYRLEEPCQVSINIMFKNERSEEVPIRGNPFIARFIDADPRNNLLDGPATTSYISSSIHRIKNFIEVETANIDYKEKNLELNVDDLITIMKSLAKIEE